MFAIVPENYTSIHTIHFFAILFVICVKRKERVLYSLHFTQHPIDAMLQFDVTANAHANIDASVNGP